MGVEIRWTSRASYWQLASVQAWPSAPCGFAALHSAAAAVADFFLILLLLLLLFFELKVCSCPWSCLFTGVYLSSFLSFGLGFSAVRGGSALIPLMGL